MIENILQNSFQEFCKVNKFEYNPKQVEIIKQLNNFLINKKDFFNLFSKKKGNYCFYLSGDIGSGKTMLMNFIYDQLDRKKLRIHFNEFMINFHDYRHEKKNKNSIKDFVRNLKKKYEIIFLDEFQVTNIVDAMILGKLFEELFNEKIKILITTNIKLKDLYKDGLQRDLFIPFIKIIEENSTQKELIIQDDYRKKLGAKNYRIFYPINEKTLFNINRYFRIITKNIKNEIKVISTKGRDLMISKYYDGIVRFNFKELCCKNLGSEDYLNLSKICSHLFIDEIPHFDESISNQQLRFITLIDIIYEKKIKLTISTASNLKNLRSSEIHFEVYKRTLSRLYELTL